MLSVLYRRQNGTLVTAIGIIAVMLVLTYTASQLWASDRITRLTQPAQDKPSKPRRPAMPSEYQYEPPIDELCLTRFAEKYLKDFRDHAVSYCKPGSRSQLTCFHGDSRTDRSKDSMCIGQGVEFDTQEGKFDLECTLRDITDEERNQGLISFSDIRPHWYSTGIPNIFHAGVSVHDHQNGEETQQVERREEETTTPKEGEDTPKKGEDKPDEGEDKPKEEDSQSRFPRNYLLLKREGISNTWHSMMEVFSSYMTIDVLRISQDPEHKGKPFFRTPEDVEDTQVVILDDHNDGPYFDAWALFAKHKPIRLKELLKDTEAIKHIKSANIIAPLAGGSNPMWQPEPEVRKCALAPTVTVFSNRVVGIFGVPEPPPRKPEDPITVTFIDRQSRRLINQTALFDDLQERYPLTTVRLIDFAAIPFAEQLRTVRETDVLVGVHGAGLTHSIFMRENVGTVVEILPGEMDHYGFRMVAAMRGLSYFQTHGTSISPERRRDLQGRLEQRAAALDRRDDWHGMDVRLEPNRFFELMDAAIKSMYSTGVWDHSVNK